MNKGNMVKVSHLNISNNLPFTLIAGPCVIESKDHALETAQKIASITKKLNIKYLIIFIYYIC